jgi:RNA polymerase sigma factor (TIGR02999 family)
MARIEGQFFSTFFARGRSFMVDTPADPPDEGRVPATELLASLYDHLRGLAAAMAGCLPPGQTLQPTALVHEAYLRLVRRNDPGWDGPRHFFGAAARAMREILIEQARRKASIKGGGQSRRVELTEGVVWIEPPADDLGRLLHAQTGVEPQPHEFGQARLLRVEALDRLVEREQVVGGWFNPDHPLGELDAP